MRICASYTGEVFLGLIRRNLLNLFNEFNEVATHVVRH